MLNRRCIGVLREVKNKWERRAPLSPAAVATLVERGVQVLIQPSNKRIYTNEEYAEAGAIITNDLQAANTILGVKEFPREQLLPGKTYVIFSHTIKGQPENMPFLDECMERKVRLVDYECIRATPDAGGQRLVAFGRFAGLAGAVDCFRGLGERLLSQGYQSPFMGVASTYMYPSLDAARRAIAEVGEEIERIGLAPSLAPLTFTLTGTGNVSQGSKEILDLLPHEWVPPEELPARVREMRLQKSPQRKVLMTQTTAADMVAPLESSERYGQPFDKKHYYANPPQYRSVFHERVLPYTSVLVNGIYWDHRFPRVVSNDQLRELETRVPSGLLGVADISCDIEGGIQFLKRATTIDKPFITYDPHTDMTTDGVSKDGVFVLGVDNLPAQLPRESTDHFSSCLLPFVEHMSHPEGNEWPEEINGAVITQDGQLRSRFEYIDQLRQAANMNLASASASDAARSAGVYKHIFTVKGHLFDSGFINRMLDLVEHEGASCDILRWNVGIDREDPSEAKLLVATDSQSEMDSVIRKIHDLSHLIPLAGATVTNAPSRDVAGERRSIRGGAQLSDTHEDSIGGRYVKRTGKRVLVLGSGFVAMPVVQQLVEHGHDVHVGGSVAGAAQRVADRYNAKWRLLDVKDTEQLNHNVAKADLVISLVPAPMHPLVAEACIANSTNMVTASYVSPELRELDAKAREAGIVIMNEVGLDPGIDHMSAMRVINTAKSQGKHITSFRSVCGGLPAPEAADNPLGYKFSWSPEGVLRASQNPARYLEDGKVIEVDGPQLLASAQPFPMNPAFALEQLPNRDSLKYVPMYGLETAHTMFRGTLRYAGFSSIMHGLAQMGLFDAEKKLPESVATWPHLLQHVAGSSSRNVDDLSATIRRRLSAASMESYSIERVIKSMKWLGMFDETAPVPDPGASPRENLCHSLEKSLSYRKGERDLVLMRHDFVIQDRRAQQKHLSSTLCVYGDEEHSAMAKTVGLPTAAAAQLVLEGRVAARGVLVPTSPDVYGPILSELHDHGIEFVEEEH